MFFYIFKSQNNVLTELHTSSNIATITATGQPKYQKHFHPLPDGFAYVPYNDIQAMKEAIADIDEGNRRVAAVMLESLQGEGGVRPGDVEYFKAVRQICDENDILLVLDEVQVGVGRTGKTWGYENLGIEPDIFTSAKGLAGGIPICCVNIHFNRLLMYAGCFYFSIYTILNICIDTCHLTVSYRLCFKCQT